MKFFNFLLVGAFVALSLSAQAREPVAGVDLGLDFRDAELNMSDASIARIMYSTSVGDPKEVTISDENLANCKVLKVDQNDDGVTFIEVSFDPELDDGRNACRVSIETEFGRHANVDLFVDIGD
jgi:hypothetical protein